MTTPTRNTGSFAIRNTRKAVEYASRCTGRILVTLPFNDYLLRGRNSGKVFTGEMRVHRKPVYRADSNVEIRADGRWFRVAAHAYRFHSSRGGPLGRAQLMFSTASTNA